MPTQHMCIEQDKKCFSFGQREKQTVKLLLLLMHEAAENEKTWIKNKNTTVKGLIFF